MPEYGFSVTRIFPYKNGIFDSVKRNAFSGIFFAVKIRRLNFLGSYWPYFLPLET